MKIDLEKWWELSDAMVRITREFNDAHKWNTFTTSYWRIRSDEALREILKLLDIEVEKWQK